jgi:hypothetical protein
VPEPDISLHFLIQRLKILNQVPKKLIQRLKAAPTGLPDGQNFSSQIMGLVAFFDSRPKPQFDFGSPEFAGVPASDTVSITTKANLQSEPSAGSTARDTGRF